MHTVILSALCSISALGCLLTTVPSIFFWTRFVALLSLSLLYLIVMLYHWDHDHVLTVTVKTGLSIQSSNNTV